MKLLLMQLSCISFSPFPVLNMWEKAKSSCSAIETKRHSFSFVWESALQLLTILSTFYVLRENCCCLRFSYYFTPSGKNSINYRSSLEKIVLFYVLYYFSIVISHHSIIWRKKSYFLYAECSRKLGSMIGTISVF